MRPLRLEVKNFLAYKQPPALSFEGLHTACLSGPNGAGKSSLLDAITWALWKKARASSDDELIHMGAEEMQVSFDFEQEHAKYRVMRKYTRKGRGRGEVNFLAWDGEAWRPVGGSASDTQHAIEDVLHLDYNTFVNSAFMRQGEADSFTVARPAERKKLLSDILGLNQWDHFEERAKAKLRQIESQIESTRYSIQDTKQQIAQEPILRQRAEAAEAQYGAAQQALEAVQTRFDQMSAVPAEAGKLNAEYEALGAQIKRTETERKNQETALARIKTRLEKLQAAVNAADQVEAGYARLIELEAAESAYHDKVNAHSKLTAELLKAQSRLSEARQVLEVQADAMRSRLSALENALVRFTEAVQKRETVLAEQAALEGLDQERESLRETQKQSAAEAASLKTRIERLNEEVEELRGKYKTVRAHPICPVCQTPLSDERRAEVLAEYEQQGTSRREELTKSEARLKELQTDDIRLTARLRDVEKMLKRRESVNKRAGEIEALMNEGAQAEAEQTEVIDNLTYLEGLLQSQHFAPELRQEIAEAESQIAGLGYDAAAHKSLRQELEQHRPFARQLDALHQAQTDLVEVEGEYQNGQQTLSDLDARLEAERQERSTREEAVKGIQTQMRLYQEVQTEVKRQREITQNARDDFQAARQNLSALDIQRKRVLELEARLEVLENEQMICKTVQEAFGKKGVPAMLIEQAIPDLEYATNDLLRRMTDGRMNVSFRLQRATKSDTVVETLEVEISDELGTRNYDLYSGGEAFRVNFALRVALSQLLTRRAGARLRTLVIDEGFGSQDATGRERLVESIRSIQDDFDLILVVTHIDELREAFPAQIAVQKNADGATVSIR